ncbi:MAG: DUF1842 domain-containing protein [Actinomycetota bacterium]
MSGTTATSGRSDVGLFVASYDIGTRAPGAPSFAVHLTVSTPAEHVTGQGRITQAVNPPVDVSTALDGDFTYMTLMPDTSHILVTLTGHPIVNWPPGGGIGPVILPNVQLRMVLVEDWSSGTANYRDLTDDGTWRTVSNVPVRIT